MSTSISIDDFVKQALAESKKPRKKAAQANASKPTDFTQTQEMLRKLKLEACVAIEVELHITEQICDCGKAYTVVNNVPLVHKTSKNLDYWEPCEDTQYPDLPRKLVRKYSDLHCCPACFNADVTIEQGDTPATNQEESK